MPKETPHTFTCGRHSHEFTESFDAGKSGETCAVESCETDVVCCLERRNQNILSSAEVMHTFETRSRKARHTQEMTQ